MSARAALAVLTLAACVPGRIDDGTVDEADFGTEVGEETDLGDPVRWDAGPVPDVESSATDESTPCEPDETCGDSTDAGSCEGSLGCACLPNGACVTNLECDDGLCVSCPFGQLGCACVVGSDCDLGLTCVDSECVVS